MVHIKGDVYFYTKSEMPSARQTDLGTGRITAYGIIMENCKQSIAPHFNFGDDTLWSGQIVVDDSVDKLKLGHWYNIHMFLLFVGDEVYEQKHNMLKIGNEYKLQEANNIIGKIIVRKYTFINDFEINKITEEQKKKRANGEE